MKNAESGVVPLLGPDEAKIQAYYGALTGEGRIYNIVLAKGEVNLSHCPQVIIEADLNVVNRANPPEVCGKEG